MSIREKPKRRAFAWPNRTGGCWTWNYEVQEQPAPGKRWQRLEYGTVSRDAAATRGQIRAYLSKEHNMTVQQIVVRR